MFLDIKIILTILNTLLSMILRQAERCPYEGSRGEKETFQSAPQEPETLPSSPPIFNSGSVSLIRYFQGDVIPVGA